METTELEDIPEYGDHMTVKQMLCAIQSGAFIDYDGCGNYATGNKMSHLEFKPSTFNPPNWATHVVWFNR